MLVLMGAAPALRAETFFLTVAGLGGEPDYEQRFSGWAKDIDKLVRAEPGSKVETLSGAEATRANIEAKLRGIAQQAKSDDQLVVMLIGHGSMDDTEYKLNLPGPDLTAGELAAMLDKVPASRQLVVNMTSASGGSLAALQKPKRAVITATKTGTEVNATVFARYWADALRDPEADTDKNEIITALEAFRYAEAKTAKFYEDQKRLATEHPLLEDTGKGEGVRAPSAENGQGLVAGRFTLLHMGEAQAQAKNPEKQALLKHKEAVEQSIDELKYRKASMSLDDYREQMSQLLVDLAKTQQELDK